MSASIQQQFTTWVRSKPADEVYDYTDCRDCAFAQFLKAEGIASSPRVLPGWWCTDGSSDLKGPIPLEVESASIAKPWTFGALAARLEASAS